MEIRSRDPGHAHLGVVLWSGRSRGQSSIIMSVPNLKQIAIFVQKLLGGPKISKLGHVTPLLDLKRYICVEIHLRILTAKFYCSILIRC